jgi:hypothetical protein
VRSGSTAPSRSRFGEARAADDGSRDLPTGRQARNKLTDHWKEHEIKEGEEFAILTNIIHQEWSGVTVKDHKNIKGLKTQNLPTGRQASAIT